MKEWYLCIPTGAQACTIGCKEVSHGGEEEEEEGEEEEGKHVLLDDRLKKKKMASMCRWMTGQMPLDDRSII